MEDGLTAAKGRAKEAVAAAKGELVEISLDIHSHPELALKEHRAAKLLADHIEAHGFRVERGAYGIETAFKGEWGEGPVTVAYLLEYDALPGDRARLRAQPHRHGRARRRVSARRLLYRRRRSGSSCWARRRRRISAARRC